MDQRNNVIHVDPQSAYTATLPAIFASAHHTMTIRELKAFLFFIGITQANTPEDERNQYHEYTFYASEVAHRLQEDYKEKKPRAIYETYKSLQRKNIEFSDERYKDEENAHRRSYALFSVVDFDGREKGKPLTLALPAKLNQFLYENKSKIPFSFDELNQMRSLNAIQVFMYLKTLESRGVNTVPIPCFITDLRLNSKVYLKFKRLNDKIIKPAIKEIRQYTQYKDFVITSDGSNGKTARNLYWQFHAPSIEEQQERRLLSAASLEPNISEKVLQFAKEKQDAIMRAIKAGFDIGYINKLLATKQDDVVFCANIDLAIMQSERSSLPPEEAGKMVLAAVSQNWVSKERNQEYLKRKELAHRARYTQCELELGIAQDIEVETNYKKKATEYFSNMTTDEKTDFFSKKKDFILNIFGHTKEFRLDKYILRKSNGKPDWRYGEVKAARDVIATMLKNGDLRA